MTNVGKHRTAKQIKLLAEQQAERTSWNDGGLIVFSGLLYFNLIELSLLNVEDLITERGKRITSFVMPERITGGKGRLVNIGKKGFVVDVINHVINYRHSNNLGVIKDTGMYAGLEPETSFFQSAKGEAFKLKKAASGNYQPYALRRYIKAFNLGEGIDTRALQESFIANVWNASRESGLGDVDILKSLQKLTGLTTNTLRPKVIRRDRTVLETIKALYENL
jgi:hypothetical protein